MPAGNGMGPMGMGQLTGRGAGYCAGFNLPGYANQAGGGFGRGFGRGVWCGFGRGRNMGNAMGFGMRNRFRAQLNQEFSPDVPAMDEKQILSAQADALSVQLDTIRERLATLES